jgi:hypothetical protein
MFAEIQGGVKTGIALSNPTNQDASISYSFTDGSGQDFGEGSFTLAAHHQMESFFDEGRFALPSSLVGTFSFSSSSPVTAIGLRTTVNQRGEVLTTTLPVSDLNHGFGGTELPIPQLGNAENWTIQIVLVNPGDALLVGTMQFFGPVSGTLSMHPTKVIVDNVSDSIVHYAIPPHGAFQIRPRPAQSSVRPGSVRIFPDPTSAVPSCLGIFSYMKDDSTVSSVSIAALPAAKASRMYVESSGVFGQPGSIQSLPIVWNSSSEPVRVQLEVLNLEGTPSGMSKSAEIPASGQMVRLVKDLLPQLPASFRGILKITAPLPVTVVGLRARYNKRGDLLVSNTQSFDESMASRTELDFPYFIHGGGYSTQLILLSTGSAHKGSLWLFSQDGTPLPPSILLPNP